MISAWIFILLSSACTILVAHLLKSGEWKALRTLHVLTVSYIAASVIAFLIGGVPNLPGDGSISLLLLASALGVIFILNFFLYSKSVHRNGVGISVAAMRLSVILPVFLSTFWYGEYLNPFEWGGVILILITLYLLLPEKQSLKPGAAPASWLLLSLFFLTGAGDSSLKIFEADYSSHLSNEQFLSIVFCISFVAGVTGIAWQRDFRFHSEEILLGLLISLPNFYSAAFLIEALSLASGAVVYASVTVLTVTGATALGFWWWGDRLNRDQWIGLALTIISLLLIFSPWQF